LSYSAIHSEKAIARLGVTALPYLVEALEDVELRSRALDRLGDLGSDARDAVTDIIPFLDDPRFREDAADAIANIGLAARNAIPSLLAALSEESTPDDQGKYADPSLSLLHAISAMGSEAKEAAPLLARALGSDSDSISFQASLALIGIGTSARQAMPAIVKSMAAGRSQARWAADVVLEIGDASAIELLWSVYRDATDTEVRTYAASTLIALSAADTCLEPSSLSSVTKLYLSEPRVGDSLVRQIAKLVNLRALYLQKSAVTDAGLSYLASLLNLRTLDLSDTSITDEGLSFLASLVNLRDLKIAGTLITNAGIKHLKPLDRLQQLNVARTNVTEPGLGAELMHLPALTVFTSTHDRGFRMGDAYPDPARIGF
jgi:HEAT repeat protein